MEKTVIIILALVLSISGVAFAVNKEKNPLKIHIDSIVVDTHNDTMMKIIDSNTWLPVMDIRGDTNLQIDIPKLRAGNLKVPFFAAYSSPYYGNPNRSVSRTLSLINALYVTESKNKDVFQITHSYNDIEDAILARKIAAVASIEGAYSIDNNNAIELLRQYDDLGVKSIGFTWNYSNALGEGAYRAYADKTGTPSSGGLTKLGEEVVREMNRLGMLIDVSHLSENTFYDVINTSKAPIIASHSGVYSIKAHERNLTDDQLRALAKNGGVLGLVLYPEFLTDNEETYIKDYVDHVDYAVKIMGIDHVGIGSDFDGATMPKDLQDSSQLYKITEELVNRGYSERDIKKFLGQNILRVIKEAEKLSDKKNKAQEIKITPTIRMSEGISDTQPLLLAKVSGLGIDRNGFRIIINGIPHNAKFNMENNTFFYKVNNPLTEKFYVVTFEAKNAVGEVQRETRIIYIK